MKNRNPRERILGELHQAADALMRAWTIALETDQDLGVRIAIDQTGETLDRAFDAIRSIWTVQDGGGTGEGR